MIDRKPPSLNELLALHNRTAFSPTKRGRAIAYAKLKWIRTSWADDMPQIRDEELATGKRSVKLTRLIGHRERAYDDDNFIGGCKPIRDALVDMGYILGDDATKAIFVYAQEKSEPGDPGLLV